MADFLPAVLNTLKWEGSAYTNIPQDSGGPTKYGITQADAITAILFNIVPHDIQVKDLTKEQAIQIYKRMYWDSCPNLSNISNQSVASKIFDSIVNIGRITAIKLLQKTLTSATGIRLIKDGELGKKTLGLINQLAPKIIINFFSLALAQYYTNIVNDHPKNGIFLKGWLRRADSFRWSVV
jgi:lysozyme family protein